MHVCGMYVFVYNYMSIEKVNGRLDIRFFRLNDQKKYEGSTEGDELNKEGKEATKNIEQK